MYLLILGLIKAWEIQAASNAECYSYKSVLPSSGDDASNPAPYVCKLHLCSFFVIQGTTFKGIYISASYGVSRTCLRNSHDCSVRYRSWDEREAIHIKQDRQCTYNKTLRRVRKVIHAVESNNSYIF
jgi:hypothetical protein